jgi:hypothetical protein
LDLRCPDSDHPRERVSGIGSALGLDEHVGARSHPPRIDRIDVDVTPRGCLDDRPRVVVHVQGVHLLRSRRAVQISKRVAEVEANPFADVDERLASAANGSHPIGHTRQRPEHQPGALDPFLDVGIRHITSDIDRVDRHQAVVFLNLCQGGVGRLLPDELVDRGEQQPLVAGQFLRGRAVPDDVDRHPIVCAKVSR